MPGESLSIIAGETEVQRGPGTNSKSMQQESGRAQVSRLPVQGPVLSSPPLTFSEEVVLKGGRSWGWGNCCRRQGLEGKNVGLQSHWEAKPLALSGSPPWRHELSYQAASIAED